MEVQDVEAEHEHAEHEAARAKSTKLDQAEIHKHPREQHAEPEDAELDQVEEPHAEILDVRGTELDQVEHEEIQDANTCAAGIRTTFKHTSRASTWRARTNKTKLEKRHEPKQLSKMLTNRTYRNADN